MGVIAKMNLILHGITTDWEIYIGDSLRNPQFDNEDFVLANPPWNQDGYDWENHRSRNTIHSDFHQKPRLIGLGFS